MPDAEELANRISTLLAAKGIPFETKRMMGGVAFMVDDKMCIGTAKNRLMVRFDPALHEEVLARLGTGPMDFTGRVMRGFVFVQPAAVRDDVRLGSWLDLALDYNPRAKRSVKKRKKESCGQSRAPILARLSQLDAGMGFFSGKIGRRGA